MVGWLHAFLEGCNAEASSRHVPRNIRKDIIPRMKGGKKKSEALVCVCLPFSTSYSGQYSSTVQHGSFVRSFVRSSS
jgi:hypothetical protein